MMGMNFQTRSRSHDIPGGILEPDDPEFRKKRRNLDRGWEPYRINHVSWWKVEMACEVEFEECWRNLERCGSDALTEHFEKIKDRCEFGKWMFGHYHENRNVGRKFMVVYEQIVRVV